jgi:DNA-binding NarL/FixJ family response regulator
MLVTTQLTAKEIAAKFGTSYRTVETQVCNVYASLGVRSRQDLVRLLAA